MYARDTLLETLRTLLELRMVQQRQCVVLHAAQTQLLQVMAETSPLVSCSSYLWLRAQGRPMLQLARTQRWVLAAVNSQSCVLNIGL